MQVLLDLIEEPDFSPSPRGLKIYEKLNYTFTVMRPTAEPIKTRDLARNEVIADYTRKELELYASGSNRVEDFGKISKFWTGLRNPDGTINSAYGHLIWFDRSCGNPEFELSGTGKDPSSAMRTPWEWARKALLDDKDTRQALLKFHKRSALWVGNKDQICTCHGIFFIRDDRLNLTMVMRANDAYRGLVFDLPFFSSLLDRMLEDLSGAYPGLQKGSYTHLAHSMHFYEKDLEAVKKMLGAAWV